MESPLKRRRAQDDLGEPPRKFSKCDPFHFSLFTIHRSNSFHNVHDDLVNGLPTVADKPSLSKAGLLSPTADKENIDPTPLTRLHNKAARRLRHKPLQQYPDIECNVGNEDCNTDTSRECWVTRDGELYTIVTGPLARSSGDEWKTLRWLPFKDRDFTDSGIRETTSCDSETSTLPSTAPPREAGPVGVVSRPPSGQFQRSTGDQKALGIVQKWINKWANNKDTNLNRIEEQNTFYKPAFKTETCFRIKPWYIKDGKPKSTGRDWVTLEDRRGEPLADTITSMGVLVVH